MIGQNEVTIYIPQRNPVSLLSLRGDFKNERGLLVIPACHTYHTLQGSLTRSLDLSLVGRNHIPSSDYVNQLSLIQFGTVNRSH